MTNKAISTGENMFTTDDVIQLAHVHYGLRVKAKKLVGEIDLNFRIEDEQGNVFVLKIAHAGEAIAQLQLQNAIIQQLGKSNSDLTLQRLISSLKGEEIVPLSLGNGSIRYMRLLTWIDGNPLAEVKPHSESLMTKMGALCGKLCKAMEGFDHPGAHRFMKWDPSQGEWIKKELHRFKGERKELVDYFYSLYETEALPVLKTLRKSINYNDVNDYNVLVNGTADNYAIAGVIDFGDAVYTNTINELAIAIAYAAMHKADPLETARQLVRGFNNVYKLEERELKVLYALINARLLISVTCSAINLEENPENEYLQISDKPAWDLLKKWRAISPSLAHYGFRDACGLIPCPQAKEFDTWLSKNYATTLTPVDLTEKYSWLDLSVGSLDVGNSDNMLRAEALDKCITQQMIQDEVTVSIGRYNEARGIYTTDAFITQGNDAPMWRTVHTGMDFFAAAGTPVQAALDGIVHSLANNAAERDYGPTIILEHRISDTLVFYTLYGHLTIDSLNSVKQGQLVKKGANIGKNRKQK